MRDVHRNTTRRDFLRVERAIRYLEKNYRRQPTLEELSRAAGLSTYHFQRLFRRWAGVSPKRFLQFLTAAHAREALAEGRSVLAAAYDAGLSGPGRLHDLLVAVDAVTPGEIRRRGTGVTIRYGFHASPFGECLVATTSRGICRLGFVTPGGRRDAVAALAAEWPGATLARDDAATRRTAAAAFGPRKLDGRPLSLYLSGTNFQIKVWEALLRIPQGTLISYGDIARSLARPGAARAVGASVGRNPVAFLIPCHRVIRSTGAFGDYRWGSTRKRAMIGWEAARQESGAY